MYGSSLTGLKLSTLSQISICHWDKEHMIETNSNSLNTFYNFTAKWCLKGQELEQEMQKLGVQADEDIVQSQVEWTDCFINRNQKQGSKWFPYRGHINLMERMWHYDLLKKIKNKNKQLPPKQMNTGNFNSIPS
jgi:hypothetical protein